MRIKPLLKLKTVLYNKKHGTDIRSIDACLNASYEKGVHIAPRTIVTDDVKIGKYSYVNTASSIENCVIGNYCSISSGVRSCSNSSSQVCMAASSSGQNASIFSVG